MKILLLLALTSRLTLAQGDLTPSPGGPTATMKTLDQIEARTPIPKTSGSPVAGPRFTITTSGSYYLTGNITVSTGSAIVIAAGVNDVTLDLNGFTIASTLTGSSSGNGVDMVDSNNRITIRNGNITSGTTVTDAGVVTPAGFSSGIFGGATQHILVNQIHVSGVTATGIVLSPRGIISECTADNCGFYGLRAEMVINSSAHLCKYGGISAENATTCIGASSNGYGIYCFGNATNCTGTTSAATSYAVDVVGTASFCRGTHTGGGTAISAAIAIGCTSGNGAISSPSKHLGTP
jgi:hypothetical protein